MILLCDVQRFFMVDRNFFLFFVKKCFKMLCWQGFWSPEFLGNYTIAHYSTLNFQILPLMAIPSYVLVPRCILDTFLWICSVRFYSTMCLWSFVKTIHTLHNAVLTILHAFEWTHVSLWTLFSRCVVLLFFHNTMINFIIFIPGKGQPVDGQGRKCCPVVQGRHSGG